MFCFLSARLGELLIYDRAAILHGQWWRLVTGSWVHFSASHLLADGFVVGVTAALIQARAERHLLMVCLLSAMAIGVANLLWLPEMSRYGGLSGVAMATTVYLGLQGLGAIKPWRELSVALLLLCPGKLALDATMDGFTLIDVVSDAASDVASDAASSAIVPAPLSNVGALCGAAVFLWSYRRQFTSFGASVWFSSQSRRRTTPAPKPSCPWP